MRSSLALAALLAGCDDKLVLDDTGAPAEGGQAVVATLSGDYSVGALATVDLDDWSVRDGLATLSSDPAVVSTGGLIVVLARGTEDGVRVYEPGRWDEPVVEFSTGDGSNPHDAELCGGALWVSLYGDARLAAYDPESGDQLAGIDLSPWDDGDGNPEAASLALRGETLYVALEQLDERTTYWSANGGKILEIDCASASVTGEWDAAPVPAIVADPDSETGLLVRTGAYFDAEGAFAWDGGLWSLEPATGALTAIGPAEDEIEANFTAIAPAAGGRALVISTDASWLYSVSCLDRLSGELTPLETVETYLPAAVANERGEAWVAARASWSAPEAVGGISVYDINSCSKSDAGEPIALDLEPYAIAFY